MWGVGCGEKEGTFSLLVTLIVITSMCWIQPMPKTVWATFRQGKVELLERIEVPDGTRVLVTILPDDETEFWLQTSQVSLDTIWNNDEDDVYAQLLQG